MEALGMIETYGLLPLVEATDAMAKAAKVVIVHRESVDLGIVSVYCRGDVAACRAAVDAGVAAAEKVGKVLASSVIPYAHPNLRETFPIEIA